MVNTKEKSYDFKPFSYVSLFSGIGGFEQALDKLGGKCVFASEIDKFAAKAYEALYGEDVLHGDVMEIDAKDVPDHDLLVGGFPCFAAGTLITTSEGVKPIEDIMAGDSVLTHNNVFKDVVVPMKKRKKGVLELQVQGSPFTRITEEHPVYVREMYRTYNTVKGNRTNKRNWSEPKWVKAKDLKKGVHFVGMSENKECSNPYEITSEDAWLIGRYVADGYIRNGKRPNRVDSYNNQVIYCVGKNKLDEFKGKVDSYYVGISEERTVFKCRITDDRLLELCLLAGRGSENKLIPGFIQDLPNNLLESFLDGYISGDGSEREGNYVATSVSKRLVYGLAQVVQKLYNTPYGIQYTKRPNTTVIEGRTVNQRDTWTIRFRKENRKQQDGVYIDGMLWMPIRSIKFDDSFDDYVYNFEVEGDNSYVANNLTVHNCQAFSVAGNRGGFDDARGTLFFEVARIASEKQPKALLLENVKGLVGHDKGKTLDTIVKTLNDIGYRVDFEVLNSKYFGVPQNRERIFIVAVREDLIPNEAWSNTKGTTVVPKGKRRISGYDDVKTFNFDWPKHEEVTTKLRDILEPEVDEKYYLSDDKTAKLVAQLEDKYEDIKGMVRGGTQKNAYEGDGSLSPTITEAMGQGGGHIPLRVEPQMLGHVDIKGNDSIKRVYSTEGINPTLTTMGGGHEPKIAERKTVIDDSKTRRGRVGKECAQTLEASSINQGTPIKDESRYRIRKLSPLECWRLQSFSDEAHEAVKQAGLSDSQRYKQAGNSVTVNVIYEIAKKLEV